MNKLNVRFFSIGMLVATIIVLLYGFFFNNESNKTDQAEAKEGYTLVENNRLDLFNEKIANLEKENEQLKATIESYKKEKSKEQKEVVYKFQIREGMSLEDIAKGLNGIYIITDQKDFVKFMVKNGYEKKIQPGEFSFKQGMSNKEIAEMITK
ncbi:endolytic transglycosylase MltG [Bacillus andreraoultii]|uniref:endolytic transglycosylase MltG n=1 Tax=Bacillus andreraoultii TaxID=1499685 RepID=UPI00067EAECC|nr:endolytic transglycosylase MltG [Bacillus andreraoultii]